MHIYLGAVNLLSIRSFTSGLSYRFTLPPFLTLKNFEGLDLGKMEKVSKE